MANAAMLGDRKIFASRMSDEEWQNLKTITPKSEYTRCSLTCIDCGDEMIPKGYLGGIVCKHFAHIAENRNCAMSVPKSPRHIELQNIIRKHIESKGLRCDEEVKIGEGPKDYRIADICIPEKMKIIEIQLSKQTKEIFKIRTNYYLEHGYDCVWFTDQKIEGDFRTNLLNENMLLIDVNRFLVKEHILETRKRKHKKNIQKIKNEILKKAHYKKKFLFRSLDRICELLKIKKIDEAISDKIKSETNVDEIINNVASLYGIQKLLRYFYGTKIERKYLNTTVCTPVCDYRFWICNCPLNCLKIGYRRDRGQKRYTIGCIKCRKRVVGFPFKTIRLTQKQRFEAINMEKYK